MADYHLFPVLQRFHGLTFRADAPALGECFCPCHDDGQTKDKKSLHVTLKDDEFGNPKILLHCHAGCSTADILRSISATFSDLFPDRSRKPNHGYSVFPKALSANTTSSPAVIDEFFTFDTEEDLSPFQPPSKPPVSTPPAQQTQTSGKEKESSAERPQPKLTQVYSYHDATGKLLHQTLRYEPKEFRQRGRAEPNRVYSLKGKEYKSFKDPHGNWWINTLSHLEPVPYRLPELLKADRSKWIFLCEGEKDADNLRTAFGVMATTVPMGSGKWRKTYAEHFRGCRVAILPDTDRPRQGQTDPAANPGYDGAKKIAQALIGIAAETRIVYLPNDFAEPLRPKWDVSDWIKAGGTKIQLAEAIQKSPKLHVDHPGLIPAGKSAAEFESAHSQGQNQNHLTSTGTAGNPALPSPTSPAPSTLPAAPDQYGAPVRGQIYNVIQTSDGFEPISMRAIKHNWINVMDNWPKRVNSTLFFVDKHSPESQLDPNFFKIQYLTSASALFGWAGDYSGTPIAWAKTAGCHSKEEVFNELQRTAEAYESAEQYPHEPRCPTVYYACKDQEQWVSQRPGCLWELLARFSPAEPVDQALMLAFMLTLVWGGPGGARPMFVITSDSGRGAGKTTFVSLLTSLFGGAMAVSSQADDDIIKQRLLSPEGRSKRVMLLDNCKSHRLSWAEFEALITSERISGKELYVGESSRANRITYCITINGPSLSTDLAQRAITIKLGKPDHDPNWFCDTAQFIQQHRISIIAELMEMLRQPGISIDTYSRWGHWEREVLCKIPDAGMCQMAIKARQLELDAEADESGLIHEFFEDQLRRNQMRVDYDRIFIPSRCAASWLDMALKKKHETATATKFIQQKINEGRLPRMEKANSPPRTQGGRRERGFWWTAEGWEPSRGEVVPGDFKAFDLDDSFFVS